MLCDQCGTTVPATARCCPQCALSTQNDVTTHVVVQGAASRVTAFTERHIVQHPAKVMTRRDGTTVVREAFRNFEFDTIIPMPDCLDGIEASRQTIDAVEALTGNSMAQLLLERNPSDVGAFFALVADRGGFHAELDSERVALLQARLGDMTDEQLEMGTRAITAIAECGYPTWYEWAAANWGTSWGAFDFRLIDDAPGRLEFRFGTAGCSPDLLFDALARAYPDLCFTTRSFDDHNEVHGEARDGVYTSGEVLELDQNSSDDK